MVCKTFRDAAQWLLLHKLAIETSPSVHDITEHSLSSFARNAARSRARIKGLGLDNHLSPMIREMSFKGTPNFDHIYSPGSTFELGEASDVPDVYYPLVNTFFVHLPRFSNLSHLEIR